MFTGIVETTGKITDFKRYSTGAVIFITCDKFLNNVKIGDSICVNGVCQTVVDMGENWFKADLSDETLSVSNFSDARIGDVVNLELALTLEKRLGGHLVSGHVDCVAFISKIIKSDNFYNIGFQIDENYTKYIVKKGSVTVNGVSLTVADISGKFFNVAVIPQTFENTNFKYLKVGGSVNIETDILAKYVEKLLSSGDNKSTIDMNLLAENGFV